MGVEVLGGGGMSVDMKKNEKKGGRTLYALPVAFLCPFGPSWPPLCVPSCPSRFRRVAPSSFRVVMLLSAGSSWCRLGVVWHVLALT